MTYRSKAFSLTYHAKRLDKKYCKNYRKLLLIFRGGGCLERQYIAKRKFLGDQQCNCLITCLRNGESFKTNEGNLRHNQ